MSITFDNGWKLGYEQCKEDVLGLIEGIPVIYKKKLDIDKAELKSKIRALNDN